MSRSLYVVAGEMSGDVHAAGLLKSLLERRPDLQIQGAGGPRMREVAGDGIRDWLDQAAVMGVVEVLKHYSFFKRSFHEMLAEIKAQRPDVLLLVDYPGFNFRFADAVRRELPDTRIVQYVCPQVWAWKKGRIPKMIRLFDEVLCLLPFEPEIFDGTGLKATFVGHPLVDELEEARVEGEREKDLVALIPGSRESEVEKLFPVMVQSAERLLEKHASLRFAVPAANEKLRQKIQEQVEKSRVRDRVEILDGGAHELMQRAACGVVASGTATVEAAYFGLPYCLVYKLAWVTFLIAKIVVKVKYAGLINILAGKEVVEELIQSDADVCNISRALERFVEDKEAVREHQSAMAETVAKLGGTGAHTRAAGAVDAWFD